MKKLLLILLLYILIGYSKLYSQINLQLLPTKEFNLISDDLINITLQSPTAENVDLQISAKHLESNQILFNANLLNFSVSTQTSFINSKTYNLTIQFNSTNLFNGSKFLKSGTYKVCVVVKTHNQAEELASECEEYKNFPINPPMLLNPEDNGVVNNLQPILNWIPPTPFYDTKNITYKLNLVIINPGQNQFEALSSNSPLLSTNVQSITNLIYPINAMPLSFGKSYAWQVEALDGNISIGKTEIWKFQIQRDSIEELKEKYKLNSFVPITQKPNNNIYLSNEDLKLQISGINLDSCIFKIYNNSNNKVVSDIDNKNVLSLADNKFILFTSNSASLKSNETYRLEILYKDEIYNFLFKYVKSN